MANVKVVISDSTISEVDSTQTKDYLYQDITSNLLLNSNKTDIIVNHDINAIFGSLKNIFTYTPGERPMLPSFGLDLRGLLYEPMNEHTANSIGMAVYNAIIAWEPRITVNNINVTADYDDNTYYVTVNFTCPRIGIEEPQQFTYQLRKTV